MGIYICIYFQPKKTSSFQLLTLLIFYKSSYLSLPNSTSFQCSIAEFLDAYVHYIRQNRHAHLISHSHNKADVMLNVLRKTSRMRISIFPVLLHLLKLPFQELNVHWLHGSSLHEYFNRFDRNSRIFLCELITWYCKYPHMVVIFTTFLYDTYTTEQKKACVHMYMYNRCVHI